MLLDPARAPQPASWDLGSAAHAILADVTQRALRETDNVRELQDERWQALLREAIADFARQLPNDLAQRRPELAFSSQQLYGFVAEVLSAHVARWRRGAFQPIACERRFAEETGKSIWPALDWQTADGQIVRLRGMIDRVDCCRDGTDLLLLVYDYKSSGATRPLNCNFLTGARLQLLCYLVAARAALERDDTVRAAGAFLAPLYPESKTLKTAYALEADESEQRMYLYRPRGVFTRDVARLLDQQLGDTASPVAAMRLKKSDGDFDSRQSADVIDAAKLRNLLELARRTVMSAADGVIAGHVVASPLVEKQTLACKWCEFQSLCRFDRTLNDVRAAEAALPRLDQIGDNAGEQTP